MEDIEKGITFLAGLWGLKLGCAPPIDRFLEKKERLEAEDCTWKWKLCPPHTIFLIRGLLLSLSTACVYLLSSVLPAALLSQQL